ncbi:GPI mannosyltransferase 2 [Pilobolus umbonatus]|nr:GPI mannosyltransferase 2 [Pilobolus umbonatus]
MLRHIYQFAATSRLITIVLGVLSYFIAGSYDSSAEIQLESSSHHPLLPFLRWDGLYFLDIAEHGYVYEQATAFFPGVPFMSRVLAYTVYLPLQTYIGLRHTLLLSGITLSNVSFVLAAGALYKLTLTLLPNNKRLSALSAIAFCLSPPAMFMSSFYTESMFALLTFTGMRWMAEKRHFQAALLWGLASAVRSNAVVYCGFFAYDLVWIPLIKKHKSLVTNVVKALVYSLLVCSGFIVFQYYAYTVFCVLDRPWCSNRIPLLYSFVQKEYWDVGFMKYYQIKEIPNFLLASPIIVISILGLKTFIEHNPTRFLSIGTLNSPTDEDKLEESSYFSDSLAVYMYLWCFLLFYSMTSMHVQVIIRFFTSLPPFYWYIAYLWDEGYRNGKNIGKANMTLGYFVLYGLVSIVLFSSFLPPA